MDEFREKWLRGNKGLIALGILLLLTTSASTIAVWKWPHDRNRQRQTDTASRLPANATPAKNGSASEANPRRDQRVVPKLIQIGGLRYASFTEAERQCRVALANARNMQMQGATLEKRIYDVADALYRQNKFADAEPFYREIVQSRQSRLEPEHDNILSAATSLGRLLIEWAWAERSTNMTAAHEHAREGEKLLRDVMAVRLENKNLLPWMMANTQSRLGDALAVLALTDPALTPMTRESMLTNAEALLQQGYAGMEQDKKPDPVFKRDALERLVRFYEAWEKPEKLAEWKQKLATFDRASVPGQRIGAGAKSE